jgi:hypothetical protein
MIKDPQIFVSEDCKKLFDDMDKRPEFKGRNNKVFFLLAVLFGYSKGAIGKKTLTKAEKAKSGLTRERYLNDKDNAILKALSLAETKKIEMADREHIHEVYSLAEEYANGGYQDLKRFVFEEPGSFAKRFASLLIEKKSEKKQ